MTKQPYDIYIISVISTIDEESLIFLIKERLGFEALAVVIMNYEGNDIEEYNKMVSSLPCRGS